MGINRIGLGFVLTARDLASRVMAGVDRRLLSLDQRISGSSVSMQRSFRRMGLGIAAITAGAFAMAGAFGAANVAAPFEQGLAAVGAVSRATTSELQMLHDAAMDAGVATQFSPDQAITGLQSLVSAGQTAVDATQSLVPALDLAAGSMGQLGVAQASEAVVGTLSAYGLAADHAAGVTDKLLRVTQLSNFQTRDFEVGLSKAAAAGSTFGQSLDDTLIVMGLLRNKNIDASSASTAYREAVRRVAAESRAQKAIEKQGVAVFDQKTQKMRSIIDIMSDLAKKTEGLSDKERNRAVVTAFGARGLLAFNSVLNASHTITRDGEKVILKGSKAIASLRSEMGDAEGTAKSFRDAMANTFQGQKTLLLGTLQTFAIAFGEPFAAVLKPVVQGVVFVANALLKAFNAIPAPIKKAFAAVVVAGGALLTIVGGALAAKAVFGLLVIAVKAVAVAAGGVVVTLLPVLAVVAALATTVVGLAIAFRKTATVGDFFQRVGEKIKLVFSGLRQVFSQGGFSGAVQEELAKTENSGLKRFIIGVYAFAYRLGRIWEGVKEAFLSVIDASMPVFRELQRSFTELGQSLGTTFSGLFGGANSLPSEKFKNFGTVIGNALGTVVRWVATFVSHWLGFVSGLVSGYRSMMRFLSPALGALVGAFGDLGSALGSLFGDGKTSTDAADDSALSWRSFGETVGKVAAGVATAVVRIITFGVELVTSVVRFVTKVSAAFGSMRDTISSVVQSIKDWFTNVLSDAFSRGFGLIRRGLVWVIKSFASAKQRFIAMIQSLVTRAKSLVAPLVEFVKGIGRAVAGVIEEVRQEVVGLLTNVPDALLPESLERLKNSSTSGSSGVQASDTFSRTEVTAARSSAATSSMPAAAEAQGKGFDVSRLEAVLMRLTNPPSKTSTGDAVQVNVQVDGETIATAVHNAERDLASRSFSPVPIF